MSSPPGEVSIIASAIRDYCANNPQAADTLLGVQRWWLGTSLPDASLEAVEAALASLVDEGVIQQRALADGTVIFFSQHMSPTP